MIVITRRRRIAKIAKHQDRNRFQQSACDVRCGCLRSTRPLLLLPSRHPTAGFAGEAAAHRWLKAARSRLRDKRVVAASQPRRRPRFLELATCTRTGAVSSATAGRSSNAKQNGATMRWTCAATSSWRLHRVQRARLPVGRLAGSQEGRERGLGRHQGAPCAGGGASRPEWEGEGRMAYMPEVRNGLAEQAGEEAGSLKGGAATGLVTS